MRSVRSIAAALATTALLALVLGGCAAQASPSPVATNQVDLPKSYKFSPAAVSVQVGTTVTWTNDDNFTHSVSFPDGAPQIIAPGESTSRTFDATGRFSYVCSLHPKDMQGVVIVTGS